ncbi:hypothetical protein [uncultured Croceitalea sp.]|uniref:hypothetical protein n=1 Tax=uncultured Croceitalea sp. TaxID=1798908 RepID=UPI00330661E4
MVNGYPNDGYEIVYPTIHADGTIYFTSWTRPGPHKGDIFVCTTQDGRYVEPKRVDELNSKHNDADPEMTRDGKFMFIASMRKGGLGHYDLYLFKRRRDGKWGEGINSGPKVNSGNMDSDPFFYQMVRRFIFQVIDWMSLNLTVKPLKITKL